MQSSSPAEQQMAKPKPKPFRAVYKILKDLEIDADVYLPTWDANNIRERCPVLINIHGGAFMLGSSAMVNKDQVQDCLDRGWIVLAPNHRLCPQVDLLEGPITDCRDLLTWIHDGGLEEAISRQDGNRAPLLDLDHVFAFGTSSGGTLALSLGFDVPRPVAGILDMYGPCDFANPFWEQRLEHVAAKLASFSDEFLGRVFQEHPVPIVGGVSLEGQAQQPPNFDDPRQAYALTQIANGRVMKTICPSSQWDKVDPQRNISSSFPPTFIIHGGSDTMVTIEVSRKLLRTLEEHGVRCAMVEVPGEEHTFAAKMKPGSSTWDMQRAGFDFLQNLI